MGQRLRAPHPSSNFGRRGAARHLQLGCTIELVDTLKLCARQALQGGLSIQQQPNHIGRDLVLDSDRLLDDADPVTVDCIDIGAMLDEQLHHGRPDHKTAACRGDAE